MRILRTDRGGVCAALNAGARAATGAYLGWVDSDDALVPTALERTAAVLDARPDVGMVYTQHLVMDATGNVLGLGQRSTLPYSKDRLLVDFMTFHFRLLRRTLFEQLCGLDETIPYAGDYDLCLRLSESTTIAHIAEPLYVYRVHDQALSKTHRAEQVAASRTAVERALVRRGLAEGASSDLPAGALDFGFLEGRAVDADLDMAAELIALQRQLDETEWWRPERLRARQLRQLGPLLAHAAEQVPFYAERLRSAGIRPRDEITETSWARLPILTRREVQELGDRLNALEIPKSHGEISLATTGGSSGVPVRVKKTAFAHLLWLAIHVREERWHREDPRGTLARIRRVPPQLSAEQAALVRSADGLTLPDWGSPSNLLWKTGPLALMDDRVPIPDQAAYLRRLRPDYLFTFPANLRLLLAHFRDEPASLDSLRSVWTMSEVVDDSLRALCREIFGCRIVHNYSTAECGYLALQCPEGDHFHVQSEVALVEILDTDGRTCRPGEIGRVVITPLHNFATPLLRYEIGDEAEVGGPCACGRGLPVLRRIVGRSYDYLTLPSGGRRHVDTGHYRICAIGAVREFQLVQCALDLIELRLVLSRALTEVERAQIHEVLASEFGPEFRFQISVHAAIERTAAGKLKSFVSRLA